MQLSNTVLFLFLCAYTEHSGCMIIVYIPRKLAMTLKNIPVMFDTLDYLFVQNRLPADQFYQKINNAQRTH